MKFGSFPVQQSLGGILVHALRHEDLHLKKGEKITPELIEKLAGIGIAEVPIALIEETDVEENLAASILAVALCGKGVILEPAFTGRANLIAQYNGVLLFQGTGIDAINQVDEGLTLATLSPMQTVTKGDILATVKIIPFAIARDRVEQAQVVARHHCLQVAPFRSQLIGLISTTLPGLKTTVIDKTAAVLAKRLEPSRGHIGEHLRVKHEGAALEAAIAKLEAGHDLIIIFGASATADRRDVVPTAMINQGGRIEHFGMPVDPGNLLLLGASRNHTPIIGAPGCARSPRQNGFDFILARLLADVPVTSTDIARMGTGGLLTEISSRPQPRQNRSG